MHVMFLLPLLLSAWLVSARNSRSSVNRAKSTNFVSTSGGKFHVNGSEFQFVGSNAYWLSTLNTDKDISDTFQSMSAAGIKVIRTWGFNDVTEIPKNGTWFQHISNGTTTINNGPNGLQRLDKVVELAEKHGIYLLLSLTNNWNPLPGIDNMNTTVPDVSRRDVTPGTDNSLNRNFLSNDYGGMDTYVRAFGLNMHHDEFYSNERIIDAFKNYTTNIVSRYVNSSGILGWELANDPRCNSSLPSFNCTPQTVTQWHSTLAKHVASMDPNHPIGSGSQGFFCTGCPKLFPMSTKPSHPAPRPSSSVNNRRRKLPTAITKKGLITERAEKRRRTREQKKREGTLNADGIRIRGRWASTTTRRQDNSLGPAFDGSHGVDSEDILGIPEIGFSTFQLFPDQNLYAADDPNLSPFNNTLQGGTEWIQKQAQTAQLSGKPSLMTGFGLVTQSNAPSFIPFNSTMVSNATSTSAGGSDNRNSTVGVTDKQRDDAYSQWLRDGISDGVNGMLQYQWGQSNLTSAIGTSISPNSTDTTVAPSNGITISPSQNQTGVSPNDGYSISGIGEDGVQMELKTASQNIGTDAR
ncbi:glycoside hydrolase family 5 protein [Piloderma croceum F 1598]|uniref:mannan endo-1,4-beta-mannosidase n=1 Tax=Piloderma croceum (strain F 1598) TaxID=765440 RepID=A0A0C3FSA9_PILCF|nr:glycoside hydrolase family 5 protein [Piloderma croceum F 1598]